MRLRHKKHLDERMAACAANLINIPVDNRDDREITREQAWIDLAAYFGDDSPIELEIGCGMGTFVCTMAARYPERHFVAVEVVGDVIVVAAEKARDAGLTNILFLRVDARYLPKYLPPACVQTLYLNFSCPYPKRAYRTHRLTHRRFLTLYRGLLAPEGCLHQKTDNRHFFEFSLTELSADGWQLTDVTLDLHADADDYADNIVTEYESRFLALGQPIYRLTAKPPVKEAL